MRKHDAPKTVASDAALARNQCVLRRRAATLNSRPTMGKNVTRQN